MKKSILMLLFISTAAARLFKTDSIAGAKQAAFIDSVQNKMPFKAFRGGIMGLLMQRSAASSLKSTVPAVEVH